MLRYYDVENQPNHTFKTFNLLGTPCLKFLTKLMYRKINQGLGECQARKQDIIWLYWLLVDITGLLPMMPTLADFNISASDWQHCQFNNCATVQLWRYLLLLCSLSRSLFYFTCTYWPVYHHECDLRQSSPSRRLNAMIYANNDLDVVDLWI